MKRWTVGVAVLTAFALAALWAAGPPSREDCSVRPLLQSSVFVKAGPSSGSGVLVRNGAATFVWTVAHVVVAGREVRRDDDGNADVVYKDVAVAQNVYANGRHVGDSVRYAKVIRCSDFTHGGEDLALLLVYEGAGFGGRGVAFDPAVGEPGDPVWLVSSLFGKPGHNTLSDGVFSTAGRLAWPGGFGPLAVDPKVLDQVSVPCHEGSSGGGVFRKKDGRCLGLVMGLLNERGASGTLIVPARRIAEYAARASCRWAFDASSPPPPALLQGRHDGGPLTDRPVPAEDE